VEKGLLTNQAETELFSTSKVNQENWFKNRRLGYLDSLHAAANGMSKENQWLLLRHLIGVSKETPHYGYHTPDIMSGLRRQFKEAPTPARVFGFQGLLDHQAGILGDAGYREQLIDLIMGENAKNELLRKIFVNYLEVVPEYEQKAIFGRILSDFADSPNQKVSIKKILEALGPFGIKAGQFLASSGLVPAEMRRELKDFFASALPVSRETMFKRLGEIFNLESNVIVKVREILGSGAINYVVLVDIRDPHTGDVRPAVVRIRRDRVEGRLINENANWEKVIARLEADGNPAIRTQASVMREVHSHAWHSLAPGGSQMDLARERHASKLAGEGYGAGADAHTGFKVRVAEPLEDLQKLVPNGLSREVSIYEYVRSSPLDAVKDLGLRRALAAQIVRAELNALFTRGIFDPDGHPGNWLVDLENRELVRIDYAELREVPVEARAPLKEVFGVLIRPYPDAKMIQTLIHGLENLFNITGYEAGGIGEVLAGILKQKGLPGSDQIDERIFYIREKLETELNRRQKTGGPVSVRLHEDVRDALGSLSRLMAFEEHAKANQLKKEFVSALNVSKVSLAVNYFSKKVVDLFSSPPVTAASICAVVNALAGQ